VLTQATVDTMFTRQQRGHDLAFYGEAPGEKPYFAHDGSNFGFFSMLFAYKEHGGQGIVVMINGDNHRLREEYMAAVAKEYHWDGFAPHAFQRAKVDAATLAADAGTYTAPDIGTVQVEYTRGRLVLHATGMRIDAEEMLPESRDRFFIPVDTEPFDFVRTPAGAVDTLVIRYPGGPVAAVRAR